MPIVEVTVYHLEMHVPSSRTVSAPREGPSVIHAKLPTVAFYRFLYNSVGQDYNCHSRASRPDPDSGVFVETPQRRPIRAK